MRSSKWRRPWDSQVRRVRHVDPKLLGLGGHRAQVVGRPHNKRYNPVVLASRRSKLVGLDYARP
eukprot:9357296-Heterocapsa_arctica.AAC.1